MKKKGIVIVLAMLLALCIGVGATLAFITVETQSIKNTFTYGDINIDLWESEIKADGTLGDKKSSLNSKVEQSGFKMIPGNTIAKDPTVTVNKGSEACWLFIKIEKGNNFDYFMTFEIAGGWNSLAGEDGVYYQAVDAVTTDTDFPVLKGNQVSVKNTVLKTDLNALSDATLPTLTFTAYAVQKANVNSAAEAWAIANPVTP